MTEYNIATNQLLLSIIQPHLERCKNLLMFSKSYLPFNYPIFFASKGIQVVNIHLDTYIQPFIKMKRSGMLLDQTVEGIKISMISFPLNYFDIIVFTNQCFGAIPYHSNQSNILKYCNRMLKNDGLMFLHTYNHNYRSTHESQFEIFDIHPKEEGDCIYIKKHHHEAPPTYHATDMESADFPWDFHHAFTEIELKNLFSSTEFDLHLNDSFYNFNQYGGYCLKK